MNVKNTVLTGAALLGLSGFALAGDKDAPENNRKLLDPANMDQSVKPGANFFLYANGTWLKNNAIPASETRWGSFNLLQENNYAALRELLETAASHVKPERVSGDAAASTEYKIGAFYRSGMDEEAINKAKLAPLSAILADIDRLSNTKDLVHEIAVLHTMGLSPLFNFYIAPDDKDVTTQIAQISQGGLGMPDRDYYFKADPRTVKIKTAYKAYVTRLFALMGESAPGAAAEMVLSLETRLADASMTRVEMRDPYKVYNKFSLASLSEQTPGMDWMVLFQALKVYNQDSLIVAQPKFFNVVAAQLARSPIDLWKKYLRFHVVNEMAPYLSREFDEARFDFYGKTVRGQEEQKPRWKRVLTVVDGSIGELLGQLYVKKYFQPEAKERMLALVNNLQQTYADRINRLDWMDASTKKKALGKLNTFMKKIGYPDKWKDYSSLSIVPDNYVANILATAAFEYNYNIGKLGRPVDRTEWGMTPPTVNAYYNPAFNEIVFPAGILQYPFYDSKADDAVNYGGIGAVIGHEMTHGFDDQGRQYDEEGNLNDWWSPADAKKFKEKTNVVVKQYNSYTVLDTMHVNGELTLGENLADLGGIAIAYEAFHKTEQAKSNQAIDGYTPDQRFFLSWAQVWRANTRPEEIASRIVTDPHSPNEWRCNGPLSNMPEFYNAFGIKPGDKMYRPEKERAKVW